MASSLLVPGVIVLSLLLRLAWVLLVPNDQYSDSVWYDGAAWRLASTGVYGLDGPSAWFPPGYSFILAPFYAVVGHVQQVGKLANVALGVAMTASTFVLGRALASRAVGLFAALLVACWPNLIFHTGILSSDLLAAFGFVFAVWLATRLPRSGRLSWLQIVGLGGFIGWMILVRPVSGILLAGIGLLWWLTTGSVWKAVRRLVPVVLVAAVLVACWTVRNYVTFGEPILIATNGGYNFWQVNQRYADGNDTFWMAVPMDDPEYRTMREGDEFTKNREGYRYGLAYLRAYPDRFFALIPAKLFWLYHSDTSGFYEGLYYAPMHGGSWLASLLIAHERLVESATFRYYELVGVLALLGALAVVVSRRNLLLPVVALPLLLTLFHMFFHAKDRFHIPLAPFIALLAAFFVVQTVAWSCSRRTMVNAP